MGLYIITGGSKGDKSGLNRPSGLSVGLAFLQPAKEFCMGWWTLGNL